jgi:hypothetical protein
MNRQGMSANAGTSSAMRRYMAREISASQYLREFREEVADDVRRELSDQRRSRSPEEREKDKDG